MLLLYMPLQIALPCKGKVTVSTVKAMSTALLLMIEEISSTDFSSTGRTRARVRYLGHSDSSVLKKGLLCALYTSPTHHNDVNALLWHAGKRGQAWAIDVIPIVSSR